MTAQDRPDPRGLLVGDRFLLDSGPSSRGWHHASTVLTCPQQWAYRYHPDLRDDPQVREKRSPPLVRGGLIHVGLAHYYRRLQAVQQHEDPNQWYTPIDALRLHTVREDEGLRPGEARCAEYLDEAENALYKYADYWSDRDFPTILGVEQEVTANLPAEGMTLDPLVTTWTISQRLDLVVADKGGKVWLEDHKTRGREDDRATRAYEHDGQFQLMRMFGGALYGERFAGCQINYLTLQSRVGFERVTVQHQPWRARCFLRTVQWAERIIQDCRRLGFDPWEYPKVCGANGSCEHRYGECPYAHLCDYGPPKEPTEKSS